MIRTFSLAALILLLVTCKVHKQTSLNTGGGSFISTIDSSLRKDIGLVELNATSAAVVFSAEFAQKVFGNGEWAKDKEFFTPDISIIKQVDTAINLQYCEAVDRHYKIHIESLCKRWKQQAPFFNKQYIGYISKGERILFIKLIDFREDPHHLKPYFISSWIDGWHGWYSSNTMLVEYNLNKNSLIL